MTQMVKNLPAMPETWVQLLGWEDPLEEGMQIHSSVLACRIPMDKGAWWATNDGFAEIDTTERLSTMQHRFRLDVKKLFWGPPLQPTVGMDSLKKQMTFHH